MPKPPRPAAVTLSRRNLLEWLGNGAVFALAGSTLAACSGNHNGNFSFEPGPTDAAIFEGWPQRTADPQNLQRLLQSWKLRVNGMVREPLELTFFDLLKLPRSNMVADLHCIEGWSVFDIPWNGVQLDQIFDQVQPLPEATHVTFHTVGGRYNESLPLDVAREPKSLLGYGVGGNTLPLRHGFPLRLVIPRLLGYKNAKYVERVELTSVPLLGYWVQRGYSYDGDVPESRLRPGRF